jgi:hypothetical protein
MKLVKIAVDDMMEIIESKMEFARDKKEMMKEKVIIKIITLIQILVLVVKD